LRRDELRFAFIRWSPLGSKRVDSGGPGRHATTWTRPHLCFDEAVATAHRKITQCVAC